MAKPTLRAVEAVRERVAALGLSWANQTDADILKALQADKIANPNPQSLRPRVLHEADLLARLTDPANGSADRLLNWANFGLVRDDIRANDHARTLTWTKVLPALGLITAEEAEAVAAYIREQVLDHSWKEEVVVLEWALGRPADLDDVAAARAVRGK